MLINCPDCGHPRVVPEFCLGHKVRCDRCLLSYKVRSLCIPARASNELAEARPDVAMTRRAVFPEVRFAPRRRRRGRQPWQEVFLSALSRALLMAGPPMVLLFVLVRMQTLTVPVDTLQICQLGGRALGYLLLVLASAAWLRLSVENARRLRWRR